MFVDWNSDPDGEWAPLAAALHDTHPVAENPYHVPSAERFDSDTDDPASVADRNGAELSTVDPEAGDVVDLTAMAD